MQDSRRVDFKDIEILEFNRILGDNPAVSSGAPIAIGDDLIHKMIVEVNDYESLRGERRPRKKLMLPVQTRAQM